MDARLRLCRSWRGRAHLSILRETPLQIVSEGDKAPEAARRVVCNFRLLLCCPEGTIGEISKMCIFR